MAVKTFEISSLIVYFMSSTLPHASVATVVTVLTGSPLIINCPSKFVPPTWSWMGPKQGQSKTLAFSGTQPHPNLKDARFEFSKNGTNFQLRLKDVRESDAGTINCQGDTFLPTVVNVIR